MKKKEKEERHFSWIQDELNGKSSLKTGGCITEFNL